MKYLFKIIMMTLVIIPVLLIEAMRSLWDYNTTGFKQCKSMYTSGVKHNWAKLFGKNRPIRF